ALVFIWGEKQPCSFRMCFPLRMENYGPLTVSVDILDIDGNPAIKKCFDTNPMSGNCVQSKPEVIHNNCAKPPFISSSFLKGEEVNLFRQCLRKTRKRPYRVTFFPAHVCIEPSGVNQVSVEQPEAAFENNETVSFLETSLESTCLEVTSMPLDSDSVNGNSVINSKEECFTDVNATNNLSEEAMNCYSDWLTSRTSDGWINDLAWSPCIPGGALRMPGKSLKRRIIEEINLSGYANTENSATISRKLKLHEL
ncbi:unnamed protein product, partial [Allacma fusca]